MHEDAALRKGQPQQRVVAAPVLVCTDVRQHRPLLGGRQKLLEPALPQRGLAAGHVEGLFELAIDVGHPAMRPWVLEGVAFIEDQSGVDQPVLAQQPQVKGRLIHGAGATPSPAAPGPRHHRGGPPVLVVGGANEQRHEAALPKRRLSSPPGRQLWHDVIRLGEERHVRAHLSAKGGQRAQRGALAGHRPADIEQLDTLLTPQICHERVGVHCGVAQVADDRHPIAGVRQYPSQDPAVDQTVTMQARRDDQHGLPVGG